MKCEGTERRSCFTLGTGEGEDLLRGEQPCDWQQCNPSGRFALAPTENWKLSHSLPPLVARHGSVTRRRPPLWARRADGAKIRAENSLRWLMIRANLSADRLEPADNFLKKKLNHSIMQITCKLSVERNGKPLTCGSQ
jgi:hypothetical protein